jgi:hypothetical protein
MSKLVGMRRRRVTGPARDAAHLISAVSLPHDLGAGLAPKILAAKILAPKINARSEPCRQRQSAGG